MKETERMMNIIHANCKRKQLAKMENEKNIQKREKKQRRIELIGLAIILITTLVIIGIFTNKQVKGCMEQGGTYEFCRYAGE